MKFNTDYLFGTTQINQMKLGKMKPIGITIHNTANTPPAINEAKNMYNNNTKKGTSGVAVNYFVDDEVTYKMLEDDIHGWHAGDGTGAGNKKTISIEICASKDYYTDRYAKAELRTVELVKYLMKKHNIPINMVKRHYDYATNKKRCPHRMFEGKPHTWKQFIDMVEKPTPKPTPPTNTKGTYKVGDTVNFTQLADKSTATAKVINAYHKTGKITHIYNGRKYPYLVNDYLGFLNDDMIENKKPTTTNKYQRPTGTYTEKGRFTNTTTANIHMRQFVPNVTGKDNGTLAPNKGVNYQDVYWGNGFVWVGNGTTWIPTAKIDGDRKVIGKPWGNYTAQTGVGVKVGDTVSFNTISNQTDGGRVTSAYYTSGIVNKIYSGTKYPYRILRNGSLIGFINDDMIVK